MANIKDVAKLAGVSVSTVSNIINDKTTVSGELYQRVTKAMQELNYHPNMLAMIVISSNLNNELVKQYKDTRVPIVFADLYPAHSDMNVVCFDNGRIIDYNSISLGPCDVSTVIFLKPQS